MSNVYKSRSAPAERDFLFHLEQIAGQLGARLPADSTEMLAAGYVQGFLKQQGIETERQTFRSIDRFAARSVPQAVLMAAVAAADRWLHPVLRGILGTLLYTHYQLIMRGYPAIWESLLRWSQSQNVIARLPSTGTAHRQIVLTTALDSSPERLLFHPQMIGKLPAALTAGSLAGLSSPLIPDTERDLRPLSILTAGLLTGAGLLALIDEQGDPVPGASGNAAAVAVLLDLARWLNKNPLPHTEIWLVFTGGTEAGNTGMDAFLKLHGQQLDEALFVVLDHIGSGELCWVTEHYLDATARYHPHPDAVKTVQRIAADHPELGMMGRSMITLDAVATLKHHGKKGIAIMGYDRVTGLPAHRFQQSDTLENIDPDTLQRTFDFLRALVLDNP